VLCVAHAVAKFAIKNTLTIECTTLDMDFPPSVGKVPIGSDAKPMPKKFGD